MAASPETETEFKPKYSAEDLKDPNKQAEALRDYLPADIDVMSSDEVDAKLEQAMRDGLVRAKTVGGEAKAVDDTFAGKMALESPIPEVQIVLDSLKNRKIAVVEEDTESEVAAGVGRSGVTDKGDEMVNLFQQAYRRGDVTLVETKAAVPGKPGRGKPTDANYQAPKPPEPAEYAWRPATRREAAIKQAFETVNATLDATTEQPKLTEAPKEMGQHRADQDRLAKEEQTKARQYHEQHKRDMADEARRKIEAVDEHKAGRAREQAERIDKYGLNQVVLPAGTQATDFDPRMQRGHYEKTNKTASGRKWVPAQLDAQGRLLREVTVTDSRIVDEARAEMEQHQLEQQYGKEGAQRVLEERERTAGTPAERAQRDFERRQQAWKDREPAAGTPEHDEWAKGEPQRLDLSRAENAFNNMHNMWVNNEPAAGTFSHDVWERSEPRLDWFGPNGDLREQNADIAKQQAFEEDREANAQREVERRYQQMIDAEPDETIKQQLRAAREKAVVEEKTRSGARTEQIGEIRAEAMNMVPEILTRAQDRERWVGETLHGYTEDGTYDPRSGERANERLRALGIENTQDAAGRTTSTNGEPFMEMNHGRVREAYYRVPGNENVVVFERYNRRNGEFISQTIMTTHEPLRRSRIGQNLMPPREIREAVNQARTQDETIRRVQEGTGLRHLARAVADYAGIAIDTGMGTQLGRIESDTGPYARRGINNARRQNMRGRQGRHGGFFYYFWNR